MIKYNFHIKRRVLISSLLTIVITLLLNDFWLTIDNSMPVTIELLGQDNVKIEIQLNKKNDNKFKKKRSEIKKTDLNNTHITKFNVKKATFPKRLKLILTPETKKQILELKEVSFRNNKYKANNFGKYTATGANIKVVDDKLVITPTANSIELIYNEPLKIHSKIKFKFEEFIIIFVLTLLLIYKLTDYLADFNTLKKESRIEIIFLTIFFTILFIPMSNINQNEKSISENRNLAKWKPLINNNGKLNYSFGKDYEKWFNDRFNLRQQLVELNSYITIVFNGKNEKGFYDKTSGILYRDWDMKYYNIKKFEKGLIELVKFNDFCTVNNFKFYTYITPPKSVIYKPSTSFLSDNNVEAYYSFLEYLKHQNKSNKFPIIYPYEEMLEASSNNLVFFKTEHHWTDDGAFIGYKKIMETIKQDYPNLQILNENDFDYFTNNLVRGDFDRKFNYGTSAGYLKIPEHLNKKMHSQYTYKYYKHKDYQNLKIEITDIQKNKSKLFKYPNAKNNLKVILIGSSMNENLSEFIPFTFTEVKQIRINGAKGISLNEQYKLIKYYKKQILDYNPDIVILGLTHINIPRLEDLFNME